MNNTADSKLTRRQEQIRKLAFMALFSALASLLMILEFPFPLVPSFVKMDLSEMPALTAAFMFGPVEGAAVCLIKNLVHIPFSTTSCIGELANFLMGASFVITAGCVYRSGRKKTPLRAILACGAGSLVIGAVSFPVNLFISYPIYQRFMPIDAIIGMYRDILPSIGSLESALLIFNVPFTILKGVLASVLHLFVYARVIRPLYEKNKNGDTKW